MHATVHMVGQRKTAKATSISLLSQTAEAQAPVTFKTKWKQQTLHQLSFKVQKCNVQDIFFLPYRVWSWQWVKATQKYHVHSLNEKAHVKAFATVSFMAGQTDKLSTLHIKTTFPFMEATTKMWPFHTSWCTLTSTISAPEEEEKRNKNT